MNVENELKHKACNIDLFAKKAIEDVVALGQYSGRLLDQANKIQMEMEMLREKNKKLKEVLEEIAIGFDTKGWNYTREDMMKIAKEVLK